MITKKYNYGSHFIDKNDVNTVIRSLKSKYLTGGSFVQKFEKGLNKKLESKYSVVCNSGTSAILLALLSINLKKNENVIIPAINFVASANICKFLGANIFFADVDRETFQTGPKQILDCIKKNRIKNVKVLFSMPLGGASNYNKEIYRIKKKLNCILIEDACHALGSKYIVDNKIYNIGCSKHSDFSIFSFHPVKAITSGEGGAICLNNYELYQKIKNLRSHGITSRKNYYYDVSNHSFNFRLSDINCALGLSQLNKINKFVSKRQRLAKRYFNNLKDLKDIIRVVNYNSKNLSSWHLLIVEINFHKLKINHKNFFTKLKKNNITAQLHYLPTYKFSAFSKYSRFKKNCKNSEYYSKSCFSIPLFFELSLSEVDLICKIIKSIIKKNLI